jgi:molybdopterin-guanine dinucleotide biosynthesis protein A
VSAAILVGGAGRRLGGRAKPSLRVGDERILDRQLLALRAAGITDIALIGGWSAPPVCGVHHVPDLVEGGGALGGLYSALLVATAPVVLVLAGDMPFVTAPWLAMLAQMSDADEAKVPRVDGQWHPLCAAYRRRVAERVKARLDRGSRRVTDALGEMRLREVSTDEVASFDTTGMLLTNVNTPDDYREAERLARLHA